MGRGNPGAGWHRLLVSCSEQRGLHSSGGGPGCCPDLHNPPAIRAWLSSPKSFITPVTVHDAEETPTFACVFCCS
ncbi:hypothetical protein MTO96_025541 [Rhipicephalus appendiculatus]